MEEGTETMYRKSNTLRRNVLITKKLPSIYEAIVTSRNMFRGKDKDEDFKRRKEYLDSIADQWRGSNPKTDIRKRLPTKY